MKDLLYQSAFWFTGIGSIGGSGPIHTMGLKNDSLIEKIKKPLLDRLWIGSQNPKNEEDWKVIADRLTDLEDVRGEWIRLEIERTKQWNANATPEVLRTFREDIAELRLEFEIRLYENFRFSGAYTFDPAKGFCLKVSNFKRTLAALDRFAQSEDSLLLGSLHLQEYGNKIPANALDLLPDLRELILETEPIHRILGRDFVPPGIIPLMLSSPHLGKLKSLKLIGHYFPPLEIVLLDSPNFKNLERLSIRNSDFNAAQIMMLAHARHFTNLRELDLRRNRGFDFDSPYRDKALEEKFHTLLRKNFPNLVRFNGKDFKPKETPSAHMSLALPAALGLEQALNQGSMAGLLLAVGVALAANLGIAASAWSKKRKADSRVAGLKPEHFQRLARNPSRASPKDLADLIQAIQELQALHSSRVYDHLALLYDIEESGVLFNEKTDAFLDDFWENGSMEDLAALSEAFVRAMREDGRIAPLRKFFRLFHVYAYDAKVQDAALDEHIELMTRFNVLYPLRLEETADLPVATLWNRLEEDLARHDAYRIKEDCEALLHAAGAEPKILLQMHGHPHALVRFAFYRHHLSSLSNEVLRRGKQLEDFRDLWLQEEEGLLPRDLHATDIVRQRAAIKITRLFAEHGVEAARRYHEPSVQDDLHYPTKPGHSSLNASFLALGAGLSVSGFESGLGSSSALPYLSLGLPLMMAGIWKWFGKKPGAYSGLSVERLEALQKYPAEALPQEIDALIDLYYEMEQEDAPERFPLLILLRKIEAAGKSLPEEVVEYLNEYWRNAGPFDIRLLAQACEVQHRAGGSLEPYLELLDLISQRSVWPEARRDAIEEYLKWSGKMNKHWRLQSSPEARSAAESFRRLEASLESGDLILIQKHFQRFIPYVENSTNLHWMMSLRAHPHAAVRLLFFRHYLNRYSGEEAKEAAENFEALWCDEEVEFLNADLRSSDPFRQRSAIEIAELFAEYGVVEAEGFFRRRSQEKN
jgi:Putative Zn-dependent protease, contains TPR repeats